MNRCWVKYFAYFFLNALFVTERCVDRDAGKLPPLQTSALQWCYNLLNFVLCIVCIIVLCVTKALVQLFFFKSSAVTSTFLTCCLICCRVSVLHCLRLNLSVDCSLPYCAITFFVFSLTHHFSSVGHSVEKTFLSENMSKPVPSRSLYAACFIGTYQHIFVGQWSLSSSSWFSAFSAFQTLLTCFCKCTGLWGIRTSTVEH